jgi:hypothetical protein
MDDDDDDDDDDNDEEKCNDAPAGRKVGLRDTDGCRCGPQQRQ